jgi:hypothetical protein
MLVDGQMLLLDDSSSADTGESQCNSGRSAAYCLSAILVVKNAVHCGASMTVQVVYLEVRALLRTYLIILHSHHRTYVFPQFLLSSLTNPHALSVHSCRYSVERRNDEPGDKLWNIPRGSDTLAWIQNRRYPTFHILTNPP